MTEAQRAQFFAMRKALDGFVAKIVDSPAEINENPAAIRTWAPGPFSAGNDTTPPDVRMYEGNPYKCNQDHDSTDNPGWNPKDSPALWSQYHGTSWETARMWITPTGAHDMYRAGEYMIYTDGITYLCKEDTVYPPDVYAQAWEKVE